MKEQATTVVPGGRAVLETPGPVQALVLDASDREAILVESVFRDGLPFNVGANGAPLGLFAPDRPCLRATPDGRRWDWPPGVVRVHVRNIGSGPVEVWIVAEKASGRV